MHPSWQTRQHGVVKLPGGTPIRVLERRVEEGTLWYHLKWIKPATLCDDEDLWGWIKVACLSDRGVFSSH